jgi:hypothetical protein
MDRHETQENEQKSEKRKKLFSRLKENLYLCG